MKTITKMLATLLLLQWSYSCASDSPVDTDNPAEAVTPRRITVNASLPSEAESRAQIAYGCQDTTREIFMWNKEDTINIINISKLAAYPYGVEGLRNLSIDGYNATFESVEPTDMAIDAGDIIFALYGNGVVGRKYNSDAKFDERDIFTISNVGTESNKPQYIVKNPDNSSLAYMRDNLKMYDIVVAEKDGEVPDLHFKHLSAIMRVTLRNATGKDIYPTKLEFKYPSVTGIESFFNTTLYCSVIGDNPDNFGLKVYDDKIEFYSGSEPYTANIGSTINGKDGTTDVGESISDGDSYELYLSTVPRINNDSYGKSLTIHMIASHDIEHPYAITLDGFNEVITAGKRYWFDLTATPEGTFMLTSQWRKLHPEN